jgi:hypothetical protein
MKKKLTEKETNFILENYTQKGAKYCSDELSIKKSTVSSFAFRNKLKVNKDIIENSRFKNKNIITVADYIDVKNPKIAYILGLIWTDGHVTFSNNKNKTKVVKHSCVEYDSFIFTNLFKELNWRHFNSENKKSIGKNTMSTHWISSDDLGSYLISNNYREKENGTSIYNRFIDLKSHFLRGLFDGDGCITISNSGKNYRQTAVYFSSSSEQNWNFLSNILDEINVRYKIRTNVDTLGKSSQLCISDSESIYNLCEFMYKDSENIRLERKHDKYNEFLEYKKKYKRNNTLINLLNK